MSAGVTVKSFPFIECDDHIAVIRVVDYDGSYYGFEFISERGMPDDPPKKRTIFKQYNSKKSAISRGHDHFQHRLRSGWKAKEDIFSVLVQSANEKEINQFLDKYGNNEAN